MAAFLLLLSLPLVEVVLSRRTQVLTCQTNPGQNSVQCEAIHIQWWRSQIRFHLPEVQQANLGSRQATVYPGRRTTDYYIRLITPGGSQRNFPARIREYATGLVTQEQRIAHLNQYLANPQPAPWVYRSHDRLGIIVGWSMMLCVVGIPTLWLAAVWLRRSIPYTVELDRASGQMVVKKRHLNGRQQFATYQLDDIVRVEINKPYGQYGSCDCVTWVVLKSGVKVNLIRNSNSCLDQHRAAKLIEQFLRN